MADAKKPAAKQPASKTATSSLGNQPIDPEGFYKIKMRRFAEVANQKFRPTLDYVVKGKVLSQLIDKVKTYEPASLAH